MSKFTIYSPDGTALYTGTPTFTGQYMKPGMVEFREVSSPSVLDFRTGCYLGYEDNGTIVPIYSRTGFVYKMYSVPQVKKQARPYSHGAAFVYQSVQLYDASKMLEFCPFRDLVAGDNRIHFSTQPSISTFEGVDGLARRFQACLEDMYGAGSWQVRVATTEEGLSQDMANLMAEARDFTVSGVNILECLDKVYEIWPEVGWIYKVESVNGSPTDTIVIGGGGLNANYGTYAYGKGKGLKSITRTVANADELANRIFAYGSSRNMLPGWYNNQSIKDAQSVDIQNLMLPVDAIPSMNWNGWGLTDGERDAAKAYVEDQASIQRLGLRPTTVYFDGIGEYPEIYPSIRNKTIGQVRNAIGSQYADYYPNPSIYTNPYERIDRVLSVDGSFDIGLVGMAGKSASVQSSEVLGDMTDSDTIEGGSNTSVVLAMRTFEMTKTCATDLYVSMTGDGTITTTGDNATVYIAISIQKGDGTDFTEVKRQLFELAPDDNGVFHTRTVSTKAKDTEVAVNDIVRVFLSLFIMNNSAADISYTYSVSPRFNFSAAWSRKKTFTITLRQLGFDIGEQAALGEGKTIAMRSGKCTGRTFTIKDVQYDAENDAWVLECFRSEDESLSQWFPNTQYPIRGQEVGYDGDEFVLLDIAMPELYISMAEGELLQAAQDLLLDTATERWQYVPDIDAKFMVENNRTIRSGEYMTLLDMDFIEAEEGTTSYFKTSNDVYLLTSHGEKIRLDDGSGSVVAALVDTIVINEGDAAIPTYKVTLRDRKRKTWTDSQGAEAPVSKSVGSITEAQAEESYSSGGDSFFMLDEDGNITLKSQYQNLWVPGWLAAGGVGDEGGGGGGGGVSYLRELTDVYHNSSSVLRADGTGAVVGDALVYTAAHGWVAAAQTGGISSVVLSAGSANGTLKLTVNDVVGSDVAVPGLGSLAFKSTLDASDIPSLSGLYLPLSGGELSGDLRLKGAQNHNRKLLFGDGNYVYLHEDTDDHLKIYGDRGIELSTGSGYGVTINGQPLDWFVVETIDNNPTLKLNPRYAGLWAEGWVAAGGAGSGSGGGGSNVSVESLADTTAQVSRIAKITIDGTDTYLYNDVAWGTATYTNNTVDVKINGTTKRLCLDGYSSGGGGGGVSSVTLAEGTAQGTLRLYVNGTAGSNVSVPGLGDLAFLDSLSASDISGLSDAYVTLSGSPQTITSAKTFQSANITLRTAYLYPYSDGSCAIGASNKRFANIYGTYGDFSRNLTLSGNSILYIGTAELSYDANTIALHLSGTDADSGRSVGLEVNDDAYIDIGKARLAYDDGAKALHITYKQGTGQTIGLYADGFVAAGGVAGQSSVRFVTVDGGDQSITGTKTFSDLKVTNLSATTTGGDIALSGTINGLTIVKEQGYISIRDASNRLYIQDNTRHLVLGGNSSSGCIYVGGYSGASGYKMYVQNGDVYFSDNAYASSWNTSSDRRLKENITTLSKADAIEKIMALNPSVWQWNSGANKGMTASGFVAQEVESVIPFMVGGKEYKSLAYQMLHAYEISALQSHEERITALEKENEELRRMLV